jgi:uncharacterized protein YndB with AHSA1/START domain
MKGARLEVSRTIRATPARLFAAWTQPAQLMRWWGPAGVTCPGADVDLRPGGSYRITNQLPSGERIFITGTFDVVDAPRKLIYSWNIEGSGNPPELVTVVFEARGDETAVRVIHERIAGEPERKSHETGWFGCLDGLAAYVT